MTGSLGLSARANYARNDVIAVVSAFNPDVAVVARLHLLAKIVTRVIVVDDSGSSPPPGQDVWSLSTFPENMEVIRNGRNSGIAASLNRGIHIALSHPIQFVLTVDQDTPLTDELITSLLESLSRTVERQEPFVAAAPASVNGSSYACVHRVAGHKCSVEVIQSGLLLHRSAFERIGLFNENLFIDGVEAEYMMRTHSLGLHVLLVDGLDLEQPLGSPLTIHAWGRSFRTSNHAPFRRYYITRNRLTLLKKYWRTDPQWARVSGARLVRHSLRAVLIEPDRAAKAKSILAGVRDALLGRAGRHD